MLTNTQKFICDALFFRLHIYNTISVVRNAYFAKKIA